MISLIFHALLIGLIAWSAGTESAGEQDPSFFGSAAREDARRLATQQAEIPEGRSVSPGAAEPYLGRYIIGADPQHSDSAITVSLVNDGPDHWSILVNEGEHSAYKLLPVARDSFVHQLDPRGQIVFTRRRGEVVAIEINRYSRTLRGMKVPNPQRDSVEQ